MVLSSLFSKFRLFLVSFVFLFFLLFLGCSSEYEITDDDVFLVDVLYEHTIMMVELSSDEQLEKIGLNGKNLKRDILLTTSDKILLLEIAYGLDLGDKRVDKKIKILEEKMVDMMEDWEFESS